MLIVFLAVGSVLGVPKEQLPTGRQDHSWSFALGATTYAALLLVRWGRVPHALGPAFSCFPWSPWLAW